MRETKYSFCRICEAACGLKLEIEDNHLVSIEPDKEHVSSQGYACIKGLSLEQFVESPDRIQRPLKKLDGKFVEISWDQAIAEISAKMRRIHRQHGGHSIAAYSGNPIGFSLWPNTLLQGFLKAFGSDKLFTVGTLDCSNKFAVADRMYGSYIRQTFPDVEHTQFLMIIGSNPAISKMSFINLPHPMEKLADIEQRGGKVVWINPRHTESSKRVGEHYPIRPDTDVFFLLGFLHAIIENDGVDEALVSQHMDGFESIRNIVKAWTPERAAEVTKIPAAQLRDLVRCYLQADGAAIYSSTGVNQGSFGTLTFWLQEVTNAVTGNLDRCGGTLMGKPSVDLEGPIEKDKFSRIANTPYITSMIPTGIMADEILTPGEGQVKALFVLAGNPLRACANSPRLEQAMEELELLVSIDLFRNETGNKADYVLPGLHFLERSDIPFYFLSGMGLMPHRYFHYTDAVLAPSGEARDEGLIFRQICSQSGFPIFGSKIVQWLFDLGEKMARLPWKLEGASERFYALLARRAKLGGLRALRSYPHGQSLDPNSPGDYFGKRLARQKHRLQLAPHEFVERCSALEATWQKEVSDTSLKLISKRERYSHNSWTHNVAKFVKGDRNTNYLYIHPMDAKARSLVDGGMAKVSANGHTVELPVKLDTDFMPGTISVPHGWGHQESDGLSIATTTIGVNANVLASDGAHSIEPVSGMSQLNGIRVEVRPV